MRPKVNAIKYVIGISYGARKAFDFFYNKLALANNGYVRARLARTPAQRAAEFIHDAMTK
jgi:hypothetical protein